MHFSTRGSRRPVEKTVYLDRRLISGFDAVDGSSTGA
jgi:hypothetical protein